MYVSCEFYFCYLFLNGKTVGLPIRCMKNLQRPTWSLACDSTHVGVRREPVGDGAREQRPVGGLAGEHVAERRVGRVRQHLQLQLRELLPEGQRRARRRDHLRRHQLALALAPVLGWKEWHIMLNNGKNTALDQPQPTETLVRKSLQYKFLWCQRQRQPFFPVHF